MSDVDPMAQEPRLDADSGSPVSADPLPPAGEGGRGGDGAHVPESGARVCEVSLEEFEGPLDLLLHLVRRHELDILDIPISFVCEKYLEYIEFMEALDLEVAGDYLVMAATLAYLKSRELVPHDNPLAEEGSPEEGGGDPREQLILRLLEYQKFKDAAGRLDARPMAGRDTFGRGAVVELPPVDAGLAPITLFRLAEAYQRVLDRARIHKSHEVVMETISVAARMEQLTVLLIERGRFDFEAIFLERPWSSESELRSMLVVTLMSVLELVRMGVASVYQPIDVDTIIVERVASAEEAREALRGYDESLSFGDGPKAAQSPADEDEDVDADEGAEVDADEGEEVDEEGDAEVDEGAEVDADMDPEDERGESPDLALEDGGVPVDDDLEDDVDWEGFAGMDDAEPEAQAEPEDGARVTESTSTDTEHAEAAPVSEAVDGPAVADAGALARSVVSEPPASDAVTDGVDEVAPVLTEDGGASESTEGDGHEHRENGEAEAIEGS